MKSLPRGQVRLRDVVESDLPLFFEYQLDTQANYLAAFISRNPADREAFNAHYTKILSDKAVIVKTILVDDMVVGHVAKFLMFDEPEITYWIGKSYWGKGIASKALSLFLKDYPPRPIFARAASDNLASIRVLEKCGFTVTGHAKAYAKARGKDIEEVIMKLI